MKTGTSFNKITIDTASAKRSKFGLAHDVYTTAGFGDTQPLGCRLLVPNSKTTLSMRHLIRLDPMVVPTYGRMKAKAWNMFVGMSDLIPRAFPAFLSKAPIAKASISTYPQVVTDLPYMTLADVSAMVLMGARISIYANIEASPNVYTPDAQLTKWTTIKDTSTLASALRNYYASNVTYTTNLPRVPGYTGGWISLSFLSANLPSSVVPFNAAGAATAAAAFNRLFEHDPTSSPSIPREELWTTVDLQSADLVITRTLTVKINNQDTSVPFAFAIKLSALGKRLRKILIGLGYQVNLASSTPVNVLPLFAYYKAWFDTFGLTLYQNWESTAAFHLLKTFDNFFDSGSVFDWSVDYFSQFVYDLGTTFVTEVQDYVSAHQSSDTVSVGVVDSDKSRGFLNNIVLDTTGSSNGVSGISQVSPSTSVSPVSSYTGHVYINRTNHTEVDAELLKILYKWTNRETIAGKRIAELLRAGGFGKYVDEQKTNFIGYEEIDIDVTDVNATADSQNTAAGKNSVLGEYVGKGIGVSHDAKTVSFENDEFGYWVTIFAIVPESGYCQGVDMTLLKIGADDFYSHDFDAVGQELQPMLVVAGSTDWSTNSMHAQFARAFGMVPRHSCYKVAHNICNGDFSLRSRRDAYLPYSMDKVLQYGDRSALPDSANPGRYDVQKYMDISQIPVAGNAWRYLNRYPWLNQFERIFTYFESDSEAFEKFVLQMNNLVNYEIVHDDEDHFTCINVLDMIMYAPMLPIEDSYGTTDDNDGKGDTTFTKA